MKKNFENIKIKYLILSKTKKELEEVIFMQENKVKELLTNVEKVSIIIKLKDKEIKDNKLYINNLEESIKNLNKEFKSLRNKKYKDAKKKINLLKLQIKNLKKDKQSNEIKNIPNFILNNIINTYNKYPIINYRNNILNYGLNKEYVTSINNEQSERSLKIEKSPKNMKVKGKSTPFILKKIDNKLKDIPIGNINKNNFIKKPDESTFRKTSVPINKKSLSFKNEKEIYYSSNRQGKNLFSKESIIYNKSFKNLKIDNCNEISNGFYHGLNNIEQKKELSEGGDLMENGISQNEIKCNSDCGKIFKNINFEEKSKNKNSMNLLFNSQTEKKDKESIDNLKLFLNKLIDDLIK